MGSFFTNVQVQVPAGGEFKTQKQVLKAVRALAKRAGLEALDAEHAHEATRSLTIVSGPRWISVYDEATEDQDPEKLALLGARLSKAAGAAAVSVLMHDGDRLELCLFEAGRELDRWCNDPDSFQEVTPHERAAWAGKPELWRGALLNDREPSDLAAQWRAGLTAEAALEPIALLLGMSPDRAALGFRSLDEYESTLGDTPGDSEVVRLAFRSSGPPLAKGLPDFHVLEWSGVRELSVGDTCELTFEVRNMGGPALGVTAVAFGEALNRRLLEAIAVSVWPSVTGTPADREQAQRVPFEEKQTKVGPGWNASFDELRVSAGIRGNFNDSPRILARVWVRARAAGEAVLMLALSPDQSPQQITFWGNTKAFRVTERPRLPLRAAPNPPVQALRDLQHPRALFALIVLGAPQAQSAQIAANAMARWHAALAPKGSYETELYANGQFSNRRIPVDQIPDGKAWQYTLAALPSCGRFLASCRDESRPSYGYDSDEDPMTVIGQGAHLGMSFTRSKRPPLVFTLELWQDLRELPASRAVNSARVLREIVNDAMSAGDVIQAAVGRWARPPENGTNPYEEACGIAGAHLAERAWTERWLRAVTEDALWLGPALRDKLGDDAPLHALAKVEPIAGGVRISPLAPVDLNALEQALAPLLPTTADAQAGARLSPAKRGPKTD